MQSKRSKDKISIVPLLVLAVLSFSVVIQPRISLCGLTAATSNSGHIQGADPKESYDWLSKQYGLYVRLPPSKMKEGIDNFCNLVAAFTSKYPGTFEAARAVVLRGDAQLLIGDAKSSLATFDEAASTLMASKNLTSDQIRDYKDYLMLKRGEAFTKTGDNESAIKSYLNAVKGDGKISQFGALAISAVEEPILLHHGESKGLFEYRKLLQVCLRQQQQIPNVTFAHVVNKYADTCAALYAKQLISLDEFARCIRDMKKYEGMLSEPQKQVIDGYLREIKGRTENKYIGDSSQHVLAQLVQDTLATEKRNTTDKRPGGPSTEPSVRGADKPRSGKYSQGSPPHVLTGTGPAPYIVPAVIGGGVLILCGVGWSLWRRRT